MLFYAQLQQMDGKWNDKWVIMVRKWMKGMSINDRKNGQFQGPTITHPIYIDLDEKTLDGKTFLSDSGTTKASGG